MAKDDDPYCEDHHPTTHLLPDTFGYWYCPDCDDELWERQQRRFIPGKRESAPAPESGELGHWGSSG